MFCKPCNKRPSVNNANYNPVNTEKCTYVPPEISCSDGQELCGVLNAWNDDVHEDFLVLSIKTIYEENGLETKKCLNIGLGWAMMVNMNIPVDSASLTVCVTRF